MDALTAALVLCSFSVSWAVVTVRFDGEFSRCQNGIELIGLDVSNFDVLMMDNENFTLNGCLRFTKDFNNPTSMNIKLERNKHGMWFPMMSRFIPNFCEVIKHPGDVWSPLMAAFKQQNCPFLAGHVETFNNTNIGTMASELVVPPSLLGEWRMFLEVLTIRSEEKENECLQANFQLEDI
ncbi:AAEL004712-PA [Aedes aegypti]|uniref:AAEL004712-PA n=2 Tax=Aedes aegypti TaxID=7159 RepID=A0A1S4F8J1_AEDAE|nr:uncharacterized protein LOC5565324 [Aedes aegypti]EAT43876.1 AAEL004712-PA [Aedes aegypti]